MEDAFMKTTITALVSTLLLASAPTFACDIDGRTGFMPENNLRIPVGAKNSSSMTEERFNEIIEKVASQYRDVVEAKGGKLQMNNNWEDDTVNASANRSGNTWHVNMYGGLARHALVTDDGFALVVCHELGHHLGGAPKYGGWGNTWASNEGQSDYFGAMKCLRKIFSEENNIRIVSQMSIDPAATEKCRDTYQNAEDMAICQRAAMAGKSLAELLGSLGGRSTVSFTTPDKSVVRKTNDAHPQAQCRLDTYFQGTLCDKDWTKDVDNKDPKIGTCIKSQGYEIGTRPLCWYKPGITE